MKLFNGLKSLIVLAFALVLSGCFDVTLNIPAQVHQNTLFSMEAIPDGNEGDVQYLWTLDGEEVSQEQIHHTILTATGTYSIALLAVDSAGDEVNKTHELTVIPQDVLNNAFDFTVNVTDQMGLALQNATVSVNDVTAQTDEFGVARFPTLGLTELMIVKATSPGYLGQTYQYEFELQATASVTLSLLQFNQNIVSINPTVENTLVENELKTTLTLPENAFVDANGALIQSDVDVSITPIDTRVLGNAFPGGATALTSAGEIQTLLTYGMANFEFRAGDDPVELAPNKTARIEVNLTNAFDPSGELLEVGDVINMWWFNEELGLWVEDGTGLIEASAASVTGLKLTADVNHFTYWAWGYGPNFGENGQVRFLCQRNGLPLEEDEYCTLDVETELFTKQVVIGASGIHIQDIPVGVEFTARASFKSGDSVWIDRVDDTFRAGFHDIELDLNYRTTKEGKVNCRIINDETTSILPCLVQVQADVVETIDTGDFPGFIADFFYTSNDILVISAELEDGLTTIVEIDTRDVVDRLNVDITFDIQEVTLSCRVTRDTLPPEDFACGALIEFENGEQNVLTPYDFSGSPLKTTFLRDASISQMSLEMTSAFDPAVVGYNSYHDSYYINGNGVQLDVDFNNDSPNIQVDYHINSQYIYNIRCAYENGTPIPYQDCYIAWYTPLEEPIIQGDLADIYEQPVGLEWMVGKVYIGERGIGFGHGQLRNRESGYSIREEVGVNPSTNENEIVFIFRNN